MDVAKNILKLRYLCAVGGLLEALSKKQAKPRGFRFKPMYFDAGKAEFNARVERLEQNAMRQTKDNMFRIILKVLLANVYNAIIPKQNLPNCIT